MQRVKRRIFSGVVCEQEVFNVSDRLTDIKKAEPRPRFKTEEEREQHKIGISRRKHARLVNENFSPRSLYSTLTLDDENEVHTFKEAKRIRDLFVRRLKYAFPDAVIFIYLGRGKNTNRIHAHMLSDGVPEEAIKKQWIYGNIVRINHLREHNYYDGVDHGQDYTGLANYLSTIGRRNKADTAGSRRATRGSRIGKRRPLQRGFTRRASRRARRRAIY